MGRLMAGWRSGVVALAVGAALLSAGCAETMMGGEKGMMKEEGMKKDDGMMKDDKGTMEKK